jgi:3-hydroxyacyl-CoA dehydrogenase
MARSAGTHALLRDGRRGQAARRRDSRQRARRRLEVAQACHFRVAAKDAKVGQPEVLLGIIPGAGGTQRLPRLRGAKMALEMCTDGKPVPAPKALAAGIIDRDRRRRPARRRDRVRQDKAQPARSARRARSRSAPTTSKAGLEACAMRASLKKTARGMRAPYASVDAIEAGAEAALRSRARSANARSSPNASPRPSRKRCAICSSPSARSPKCPTSRRTTPVKEIKRAAVVGAGTMGGGIAMNYANAGIPVLPQGVDQAALDRGPGDDPAQLRSDDVEGQDDRGAGREDHGADHADDQLRRVRPGGHRDEAVFENMDLKKTTFAELGKVTRPGLRPRVELVDARHRRVRARERTAVAGARASLLQPGERDEAARNRPRQRDEPGSDRHVAQARQAARQRSAWSSATAFGFVANRMLAYYMREAYLLLEEGASVEQIDRVLTEFGLPVGPYGMQDIAGIDVGARIRQYLASIGKTRAEGPQSAIPDRLFEMGRYGQKTGAGWYKYDAPGSRNRTPIR